MKKICGKLFLLSVLAIINTFLFPEKSYAVPPPEFLFSVGSQIAQIFSIIFLFLSAIFATSYRFIKARLDLMKSKKPIFIATSVLIILGISLASAYYYGEFKQNQEYKKWLQESQGYSQLRPEIDNSALDKLSIGNSKKILRSQPKADEKFLPNIEKTSSDEVTKFIEKYYGAIANQELETAYELSKKNTSLETFKSWYKDTSQVVIDKLVRIDEQTSSLELTLYEGEKYTRYGVLITLKLNNGTPTQIAQSTVRVLDEQVKKQSDKLSISNSALNEIINSSGDDYIILDAREDLEYKNGFLPGSIHIRYADLQAGKWLEIPEDKFVYVLCWSGIRGKEVTEFLREKNLLASFLENGANGWVEWGGKWTGSIKFAQKYSEAKYKKLFSTDEVKTKVSEGVILVDSREPWKFKDWSISGSFNIPIMYTPSKDLAKTFAQIPPNSTVITICDGYVNCFDAKITAVELEERGHTFIGRYNKPWEYE